jgi:D-alanine-D-alanine ligase-like ATP-grasp enzyme
VSSGIIRILVDRAGLDLLAWIHRREARGIAAELRAAGHEVSLGTDRGGAKVLLRLSDPAMREAVAALDGAPYAGPGRAALERCYDKYEATRAVAAAGIACPETALAGQEATIAPPRLAKPRRGSDSIGLRVLRDGARAPAGHVVQSRVRGTELTVAVFRGQAGMPLAIELPEGSPYTFWRKYLFPAPRSALEHPGAGALALRIARLLGVDWAARVDLIQESGTGRLVFLECDAAPLVGVRSAWAASFSAAGVPRATQLAWLLDSPQR